MIYLSLMIGTKLVYCGDTKKFQALPLLFLPGHNGSATY
jgi:ribonuclease BN (tRNA processing enzyme)